MESGEYSSGRKPVTHRAQWVAVEPGNILQNGYVVVQEGFIIEIGTGSKSIDGPIIDHGDGAIIPGLVNAHTHLELCALKDKLDPQQGFQAWVQDLISQRERLETETIFEEAGQGIQQLLETGCIAAGEIATLGLTRDLFMSSPLLGIWFQELLGEHLSPDTRLTCRKGPRQSVSLAGHAPHTTSPELLNRLKTLTQKGKLLFSLHLGESDAESEFIATGKGAWADFLRERKIDFSFWGVGNNLTPVAYASRNNLLDEHTLAVHLIQADQNDMEILQSSRTPVCVCLRSNQALHGKLPDIPVMLQHGLLLCLGTDSLASVDSLDLFDEMKFTATCFPDIPPAAILAMATRNGALALGLDGLAGTLRPGEIGSFLYLDLAAANMNQLLESIVHKAFTAPVKRTGAETADGKEEQL